MGNNIVASRLQHQYKSSQVKPIFCSKAMGSLPFNITYAPMSGKRKNLPPLIHHRIGYREADESMRLVSRGHLDANYRMSPSKFPEPTAASVSEDAQSHRKKAMVSHRTLSKLCTPLLDDYVSSNVDTNTKMPLRGTQLLKKLSDPLHNYFTEQKCVLPPIKISNSTIPDPVHLDVTRSKGHIACDKY